jgi:uncharacterized protein (DUF362 family)
MHSSTQPLPPESKTLESPGFDRRKLLLGGGAAVAGLAAAGWFSRTYHQHAHVFIAKGQKYAGPLVATMRDGLIAAGIDPRWIAGRKVLLKPNLVEPNRAIAHMTTHPSIILAATEVFRTWGAKVTVGEGPGHVRDTEMALEVSGVREALDDSALPFADLNYQEVAWRSNGAAASDLPGFFLPSSVLEADLVVSLPKLKTHHWAGMTAAMKNFYGVIPGIKYGWPKNVLHHHGIPQTVCDINATLLRTATIVDAIDCMEGDGPIMGTLKPLGLLLIGTNLPAVDATAARVMGLVPERVEYLALAADRLGPISERRIHQRGERWQEVASPFQVMAHMQHLVSREWVKG